MSEMNRKFCQCCGMPLGDTDCFQNGEFTFKGTMEEMIELCVPNMAGANPNMTEEQARRAMREWFPTLKRWR